jgi:hypothetical protein
MTPPHSTPDGSSPPDPPPLPLLPPVPPLPPSDELEVEFVELEFVPPLEFDSVAPLEFELWLVPPLPEPSLELPLFEAVEPQPLAAAVPNNAHPIPKHKLTSRIDAPLFGENYLEACFKYRGFAHSMRCFR